MLEGAGTVAGLVAACVTASVFGRRWPSPAPDDTGRRRDELLLVAARWLGLSAVAAAVADRWLLDALGELWQHPTAAASLLGEMVENLAFIAAAVLVLVGLTRAVSRQTEIDDEGVKRSCSDASDHI